MPHRARTKAPGWLFFVALVAAWLLGAEVAILTSLGRHLSARLPGLAVWTFVMFSVAFLVVTGRRELQGGRQTARLIAQLREALRSFGMLTESSLTALPLDQLLQQLLARLGDALETEFAAILLCDAAGEFTLAASAGLGPPGALQVTASQGLIASLATASTPQAVHDAKALALLSSQFQRPLGSAAGCTIRVDERLLGVCVVGTSSSRRFDDRRLQLLQLVADRAGVGIDRARLSEAQERSSADAEQTRRYAVLLAHASEVLLTAKDDYEDNLAALLGVVVPEFSQWCTIELSDPHGDRRTVSAGPILETTADETSPDGSDLCADRLRACFPETVGMAAEALGSGGSVLGADERTIAVGLRAGDSVIGTMTVANERDRRPYRATDVATAVELADRAAIMVERVLRYREAEEMAHRSQRRAAQLHQLVRASIDVHQLRNESEIMAKATEGARCVFDAEAAIVSVDVGSDGPKRALARAGSQTVLDQTVLDQTVSGQTLSGQAVLGGIDLHAASIEVPGGATDGRPWRTGGWLGVPLAAHQVSAGGAVAILGSPDTDFSADDEAILVLLAQMVSAALDNARLYHATATSEARWRVLVEAAPIGIIEVNLAGDILWWNGAAMVLFGWPDPRQPPSLEARPLGSADDKHFGGGSPSFAPDVAAGLRSLWSDVIDGSPVVDRGVTAMSVQGDIRDLAVSAAPLRSAQGTIHGILTMVVDVTDRRRFEAELARAQRMEAIAQLAGGVAHDFNNLLTLITGYTDLLNYRLDVDEHSVRLVEGVHAAVTRASLLTGQLLSISRNQAARPVVLEPVEALRSSSEVLQRILGTGIELGWALDPSAGRVHIDPGQLEQVILNLAINARDAMPTGGRLDIAVSPCELGAIQAAGLGIGAGRYVRISVSDTGVGMDAETRLRCFDPLFSTKGPARGTGLGLAAVKGVVGESGGAVQVDSAQGVGTTFVVYLPAVSEPPAEILGDPGRDVAVEDAPPNHAALARTPTILVAEDDGPQRQLMSQILTRAGYHVLEASGGCEALTVAEAWPGAIDGLISDVVMPGMSGTDVASTLLAIRPALRVLFVSGGTGDALMTSALPDPGSLLAKPFKPSYLLTRVQELLAD